MYSNYLFNTLLHQHDKGQKEKNHWCKGGLITTGDLFQATPAIKK